VLVLCENSVVSVIVPTKNSEKTLQRCLKSVRQQSYPHIEVIVVDNFSADATKAIAEEFADLILLKGPERSAQVNYGARYARGKYIYRVDSDFVIEPTVIEEAILKCEKEKFDAICVHNASDSSVSFWSKIRKLERDCYAGDNLNVAVRFIRKTIFNQVNGFDEKLIAAEDYDLHNKILEHGYKVGEIKAKELHLGEPKTLSEIVTKHYYYGKTIRIFLKTNPKRGKKQISPIRPALFRNWRKFLNQPLLALGFIIYQTVRYFSAFLGYMSQV
jgi:glycosyltransferase involved in cell wall biosynthesis